MSNIMKIQFNFEMVSRLIDKDSQEMKSYETHFKENMLPELKEVEQRKTRAREKAYQLRIS
ncbi:hypothetical protein [Desulfonatronospira sp.]|uniref:hypothetical protein n=1 Tax=Desulfonatronospira sp. TaxID=1962951 RepID=UPI0025BD4536|nr:hypothetical protein [Desulfonatronospira sp.]